MYEFKPQSTAGRASIQPKLKIGQPGDKYEQEADAVADRVMRTGQTESLQMQPEEEEEEPIQMKCAECEKEEEMLQRKSDEKGFAPSFVEQQIHSSIGKGNKLPDPVNQFMSRAIGTDFSQVQIHTDTNAVQMNRQLGARAFTYGSDVYFNRGEYEPDSLTGKNLLAHELTHVVQQKGQRGNRISKAVSTHSSCPPNVAGAPAQPLTIIENANNRAVLMALGTAELLAFESLLFNDPTFGPSFVFNAYHRRFGDPPPHNHKFRNRFTHHDFSTLAEAQASEMMTLSDRFRAISRFLERQIKFRCTGNAHTIIGNCTHHCRPGDVLASCAAGHGNTIAICSDFFTSGYSTDQQAIGMIHEVLHMTRHFGDHASANTARQRGGEPECYASLVGDIYGATPFDPSCPAV